MLDIMFNIVQFQDQAKKLEERERKCGDRQIDRQIDREREREREDRDRDITRHPVGMSSDTILRAL